ncbi:MAG: WD40 repeat domain-containing protein [Ginsengibacter sp.]
MTTENPFKGPSSYEDGDKFYGRDNEIKEITGLIKNDALTLLFSRSGTGKSSIIKAGIFPVLKTEYEFFPIYIHLNDGAVKETSAKNLCDFIIKRSLDDIKEYFSTKENFTILSPENSKPHSLFEFTHNLQIMGTDKSSADDESPIQYLIKPVFFFDQFEEIFTQPFDKTELQFLLNEIKCLVENEVPDYLKEEIISSKDNQYIRLRNALKSKQKNFRVVFSFREEYLPQFESLRNEIPSIRFTNSRYRLEPFSVATAKTIIVKTATAISDETALDVSESIAMQIDGFDEPKVDPFLLSLICQIIYPDLLQQNHTSSEESKLRIKSLVENAIESYVAKVYKTIDEETKKFIEQKLITSDGKKNSVNYNEVVNNSRLQLNLQKLAENPNYRLLSIGQFLDSRHISILHDRLLPPLIKRKEERKSKEDYEAFLITQKNWNDRNKKRQMYFLSFFIAGLIVFGSIYYIIYQNKQKAGELREEAKTAYAEAETQKKQNLFLSRQAESLNDKAEHEHLLAVAEKDSTLRAILLATENQKKFLNQKKLTDSIVKVSSTLQKVTASLQKSIDTNLVREDLNRHNINYYLGNEASMLPLIFNRLLQAKATKNEGRYQQLLESIDSTLQLTSKYATNGRPREMLEETKAFWKNNHDNEVVDSILTGFLNSNLYYQQKIELDEANKMASDSIKKNLFVLNPGEYNSDPHFAFSYNKNNYSGTLNNNEVISLKKNPVTLLPGDILFKEKYKGTIGTFSNIIFSPDSTHAITYDQPESVTLWNINNSEDKHLLKTDSSKIKSILFSKNSKKILILSGKGLSLYDPKLQYKEVRLNLGNRVTAVNFTDDGNKIITLGNSGKYFYSLRADFYDISKLDASHLNLDASKELAFVPYGDQVYTWQEVSSVSLSSDEKKMLLRTTKGIIIYNLQNPDAGDIAYANNGVAMLHYKKFYNSDIIKEAIFIDSNSIVTISDSSNVYLVKSYPDFKSSNEAFKKIKIPTLSLLDSLNISPNDNVLYNKILSSGNERYLRVAAKYYYTNYNGQPDCFICNLLKSKELYMKLLAITTNNNTINQDAANLIITIKLLSGLDNSYQNKEVYFNQIVDIANRYKNSQSQHDLSTDYGNLAFYSFFVKDFNNALKYALKGIYLDSTNDYIYTNLALGYLFTNQFAKAEEVYNRFKNKRISDRQMLFRDGFKQDFRDLETNGIINKNDYEIYDEVEKIRNLILN